MAQTTRGQCKNCVHSAEIPKKVRTREDQLFCCFLPPGPFMSGMMARPMMSQEGSVLNPKNPPMMMSRFDTATEWAFPRTLAAWCCGQFDAGQ